MEPLDVEQFLSTPAIWTPGQSDEQWQGEIDRMIERTFLTRAFVDGEISPADFEEGLFENGVDPYWAAEIWEEGISFSGK